MIPYIDDIVALSSYILIDATGCLFFILKSEADKEEKQANLYTPKNGEKNERVEAPRTRTMKKDEYILRINQAKINPIGQ